MWSTVRESDFLRDWVPGRGTEEALGLRAPPREEEEELEAETDLREP